jgi:ligand-binding sensor domain-containing protein
VCLFPDKYHSEISGRLTAGIGLGSEAGERGRRKIRTLLIVAIRRSNLVVAVLSFCALRATAAFGSQKLDPSKTIAEYVTDVWHTEQGLPQNSVRSIAQTPDGYLWLATEQGLARFDGIKFTVFDQRNTSELSANEITALLVDTQGALWIGTHGGGLSRYAHGKVSTYTAKDGLKSNSILSLYFDKEGVLWI